MIKVSDYLTANPDVRAYLQEENPLNPAAVSLVAPQAQIKSELKAITVPGRIWSISFCSGGWKLYRITGIMLV
jgi:hypothetical protein